MIRVQNVTRKYGDFTAVDDVSFEITPGEIVGLLGHNGAGKTTIMKMLTGCLEPTHGQLTIDELDITKDRFQIQKKIGYLPENCPIYPEMTVLGYLDYSAALHNVPGDERKALIREAIERTSLQDKATDKIATLSRGYRQRTGVAQAILHKPSILILDEPTNGLDPTQIQQMRALITELAKTSTVIISTHILQEVQAICGRVIIINDGKMALDSRLDQLQLNNKLLVTTDADKEKAMELFTSFSQVSSAVRVNTSEPNSKISKFELQLEDDQCSNDTAAAISRSIHEHGWQLYAIHYESRNLEKVFADISV